MDVSMPILHIRQDAPKDGVYPIRLTLKRPESPDLEAEAAIAFALSPQEQEDIRWYMEDYLQRAEATQEITVRQIEDMMKRRGVELFEKMLEGGGDMAKAPDARRLFDKAFDGLADLRVEIACGVAEAASIPWELMREPSSDSAIALRAKSFVRVQRNPTIAFVPVPPLDTGRVRLLYIACRPNGRDDVELRAVANRLLQDLGADLARFEITALRPPTFEQLQKELNNAKAAGRPYHIVHFDGHGIYEDLSTTALAEWLASLSALTLGGGKPGKHGYLIFEHPDSKEKMRPVDGATLGKLLHDAGTPILVLNACQSAMHQATAAPRDAENVHDEIRAIGSLAQAVSDQGIPAVLGMRYSVYVVTAAQYIGQLYANLAKGRGFGQAASEGRKHLQLNPERWIGLQPRPLQDWFVPVVHEAAPIQLLDAARPLPLGEEREMDPVQRDHRLLRYVPDHGFIGRDETLLALDRAFDAQRVVLLHAYAGQGKTTTAVEFARWYARTGGLGPQPIVLVTSFESRANLDDALNQIGAPFARLLAANGIEWHALNDTNARRQIVIQLLRAVPVLWIWNNVEPVAGFPEGTPSQWTQPEQEDLALFLKQLQQDKASRVKLLLTSRRDEKKWLGGVPYRIEMPRMRNSDAAALALKLGEEHRLTRESIGDWQPLLDYCQGNPLTLRVLVGQAVKEGRNNRKEVEDFVEAIRSGEKNISEFDEKEGRDKSLGASLDYGFKHAFNDDELPIIALLHLFQGVVDVDVLHYMGNLEKHPLPVLEGKTKEHLTALLVRAKDTGLLTQIGLQYFAIHPALPWFLKSLYERYYARVEENALPDGRAAAPPLQAWVEAIGELGSLYHDEYNEGNRGVIKALEIEEANLLHARRLARRYRWWSGVVTVMQGLKMLYDHRGRAAEWAPLVHEIVPDLCDTNDQPIPGREDQYTLVMDYRVRLAIKQERDLDKATRLQEKLIEWVRRQAAAVLTLPNDAELDDTQRYLLHTLGVSNFTLGYILCEQGNGVCVERYRETIRLAQHIKDTAGEAIAHFNMGHAYLDIPDIRDLDAAEAAYQHSLKLRHLDDAFGRSGCIMQIGMVHHERFKNARRRGEAPETVLRHAQTAEERYLEALHLCPKDAIAALGPMHNQLGNLYREVGQIESAREHYEKAVLYYDRSGDRYNTGGTRFNISRMYEQAARKAAAAEKQAATPSEQAQHRIARRELLERAKAYAEAALRDFEFYQGYSATDEAKARAQIADIEQALCNLDSTSS